MKTFLYTQNESAIQKNTMIIDGDILDDFNDKAVEEAFQVIKKMSDDRGKWQWLINFLIKQGYIKSIQFRLSEKSSGVFIQSNFYEKDEVGRFMPFIFYSDNKNLLEANRILKQYSKQINRTYDEQALLRIDKAIKMVICGSISISLIILGLIIWKI